MQKSARLTVTYAMCGAHSGSPNKTALLLYANISYYYVLLPRVHNIRGRGEYLTSLVWPNALRKVMT